MLVPPTGELTRAAGIDTVGAARPRLGQRHLALKTGFSLATNAATAARWSSVAPVFCIIALSSASDSSKVCEPA